MENINLVVEYISDVHELERLYRKDTDLFKKMFIEAFSLYSDSETLIIWNERLNFSEENKPKSFFVEKDFILMIALAIVSGICTRVLFYFVEKQMIAPINLIFGIVPFLAIYFMHQNRIDRKLLILLIGLLTLTIIIINNISSTNSDSTILAYLHLPILLWVWMGLAFTGNNYKLGTARLAYLKFNGEFVILYVIMAISGIILTAITMQLFFLIELDISEFYFTNIVLFGAASLSVVATYLVSKNLKLAKNIAPYIAGIFSPLVLITLIVYLVSVVFVGKNPFLDRDFLLLFNTILLIVLAISIFSITESHVYEHKKLSDYINFALITIALIIDSVALSAIVFRLSSYGITPNRIAVLGINLIILINLAWIMFEYLRFIRYKTNIESIQNAVTKYLPIYGLWSLVVIIVFPLIF